MQSEPPAPSAICAAAASRIRAPRGAHRVGRRRRLGRRRSGRAGAGRARGAGGHASRRRARVQAGRQPGGHARYQLQRQSQQLVRQRAHPNVRRGAPATVRRAPVGARRGGGQSPCRLGEGARWLRPSGACTPRRCPRQEGCSHPLPWERPGPQACAGAACRAWRPRCAGPRLSSAWCSAAGAASCRPSSLAGAAASAAAGGPGAARTASSAPAISCARGRCGGPHRASHAGRRAAARARGAAGRAPARAWVLWGGGLGGPAAAAGPAGRARRRVRHRRGDEGAQGKLKRTRAGAREREPKQGRAWKRSDAYTPSLQRRRKAPCGALARKAASAARPGQKASRRASRPSAAV